MLDADFIDVFALFDWLATSRKPEVSERNVAVRSSSATSDQDLGISFMAFQKTFIHSGTLS